MAKNKMYEMIIDDSENVYKVTRCAMNKNDLIKMYGGNGEFVRVKEVTNDFPIAEQKVYEALQVANFGESETETILHLLRMGYENVI